MYLPVLMKFTQFWYLCKVRLDNLIFHIYELNMRSPWFPSIYTYIFYCDLVIQKQEKEMVDGIGMCRRLGMDIVRPGPDPTRFTWART